MTYDGVDLFAGPGGWDVAAARLGLHVLGVEHDAAACATRRAAGHPTLEADVLTVDPWPHHGVPLLIASPPCQTFSQAGKGSGRKQLDLLVRAVHRIGRGEWPTAEIDATHDERTVLVLEALRWAMVCEPERVAFEQVPGVLPVWEAMAHVLRGLGYSAWSGVLSAEEYGVPQTRKRAVLMASRAGPVQPPAPTHRAYLPHEPDGGRYGDGTGSLFGDDLLPWVAMADALGWHNEALVGFPRRPETDRDDGRAVDDRTVVLGGEVYRARDMRPASEPAQVVTEKARSWTLHTPSMDRAYDRSVPRTGDEPAPTIAVGNAAAQLRWQVNTGRDWKEGGTREDAQTFDPDERPAPAVDTKGRWHVQAIVAERLNDQTGTPVDLEWPDNRPATVVAGRDLVQHPGATTNRHNDSTKSRNDGIRVTLEEAAALQSFPAGYPWQGSNSKRFQQVGNAVPPRLAEAVLRALLGLPTTDE